ncbi:hypothetical protein [Bifidobacterium leontopitheci]|uniref:Protease n=1 Tax=Bifidobacterium leontopitheci TaxID=2650774 RepID=A0A6I1GHT5_9BIFI|nr:hypothetical protein [Bifidobacterium leontopitheci]KAB7788987.1 protease [Bifidobacterium leontopitheci]
MSESPTRDAKLSRTRRIGVAVLAAGLAIATASGVMSVLGSGSQPDMTGVVAYAAPKPDAYTAAAKKLGTGLTKAISKDLKLSGAQYLALADAGRQAAATVKSLGGGVKTSWIDRDGTLHVIAADATTAQKATLAGAQSSTSDPLGDEAAAKQAADSTRTYWVDRQAGKVKSYAKKSLKLMSGLSDGKLLGGTGYMISVSGALARCSAGFAGTDGLGRPVDLTAGHCVASDDTNVAIPAMNYAVPANYLDRQWGPEDAQQTAGYAAQGYLGDGNDAGLLNLEAGKYTATPQVSTWGADGKDVAAGKGEGLYSQDDGTPVDVYDATDATIGAPACKSGSTSGWTCGVITKTGVTEQINDNGTQTDVYGFQFTACMLSGDSGGAIVSGNYALGVDSYGNMGSCDDASKDDAVAGGYAVVAGDKNAEKLFGHTFNLAIHVGQPAFGALTADRISGTVDAATGAKVAVTVDGKSYTAIVRNGGAWSVKLSKALAAGSHTVSAVASLKATGSDLTTTGETATKQFTL